MLVVDKFIHYSCSVFISTKVTSHFIASLSLKLLKILLKIFFDR